MARYSDLLENESAKRVLSELTRASEAEIEKSIQLFSDLPEDYRDFLREVGHGTIGESGYSLYGGVIAPDEIFDQEKSAELSGYWLVGDDFSGYCAAFDPKDRTIVEINPLDLAIGKVADTFEQFIRDKVEEVAAY